MTTPTPGRWFYDEETATVHADREIVHNSDDWLVAFLISAETTPGMENRIPVEEMDANGFLMAAAPALLEAAKAARDVIDSLVGILDGYQEPASLPLLNYADSVQGKLRAAIQRAGGTP